jgi:DNA sulfur modification protein DndD
MLINHVEFHNFRIYKGTNQISFSPKEAKNISIICGRNGYGKTTFLMGLVWCLYGKHMEEVDELYKKEIKENGGYRMYIANSLNKLAKKEGESKFHVAITFTEVNIPSVPCKEIRIIREFNIYNPKDGDPEIYIDGHKNELTKDIENGNQLFIQELILPKEIAKFFFFDAEKIVTLATELNKQETRRKLSEAYSEVLGIKKYRDLKEHLEEVFSEIKKESASVADRQQLNTLNADIENLGVELSEAENRIQELEQEKSETNYKINQLQEKLIRAGNAITVEELESLREQKQRLQEESDTLKGKLKDLFEIVPFAIAGGKLTVVYEQVHQESEQKAESYRLDDLRIKMDSILTSFERDTDVDRLQDILIHRDVKKFFVRKLEENLNRFFGIAELEVQKSEKVKSLHDFSESEKNELETLLTNLRSNYKDLFARISKDYSRARNELNLISRKLAQAESNEEKPHIAEYRRQKQEFDHRLIQIDNEIKRLSEKVGKLNNQKTQFVKQKSDLSYKIQASEKNKDKSELIEKEIKILNDFIKSFKERKKKSLEDQILNCLDIFMHKRNFIKRVQIDIMDNDEIDINLYDESNERVDLGQLSMGERQLYASALLQGLVEESSINFPVFIDSPMQKLDDKHAENIIKHFYPNVSNQVVLSPIPIREMNKYEFDLVKSHVNSCYIINNINESASEFISVETDKLFNVFEQLTHEPNH